MQLVKDQNLFDMNELKGKERRWVGEIWRKRRMISIVKKKRRKVFVGFIKSKIKKKKKITRVWKSRVFFFQCACMRWEFSLKCMSKWIVILRVGDETNVKKKKKKGKKIFLSLFVIDEKDWNVNHKDETIIYVTFCNLNSPLVNTERMFWIRLVINPMNVCP